MRSGICRHLGVVLTLVCPLPAVLGQVHAHHPHMLPDPDPLGTQRIHQVDAQMQNIYDHFQGGVSYFSTQGTWNGYHWTAFQLIWAPPKVNSWTGRMPLFVPTYPMIYDPNILHSGDPSVSIARPAWLKPDNTPPLPIPILRKPRALSPAAKTKANDYIADGDAQFAKQKYTTAVQRYQAASRVAPDLPDPYFRQGFALIARGDYHGAVNVFRTGLKLRSEWNDSDFHLDTIYAGGALDKANQKLAQRLSQDPLDPDLLWARGMQLFFDGQQSSSTIYFAQAAQLNADDAGLLAYFVSPAEQAPAVSREP